MISDFMIGKNIGRKMGKTNYHNPVKALHIITTMFTISA